MGRNRNLTRVFVVTLVSLMAWPWGFALGGEVREGIREVRGSENRQSLCDSPSVHFSGRRDRPETLTFLSENDSELGENGDEAAQSPILPGIPFISPLPFYPVSTRVAALRDGAAISDSSNRLCRLRC